MAGVGVIPNCVYFGTIVCICMHVLQKHTVLHGFLFFIMYVHYLFGLNLVSTTLSGYQLLLLCSVPKGVVTKLSKFDIQKDLESAQRKQREQNILSSILETDDLGLIFDNDSIDFAQGIKQGLRDSRELQKNLEASIRKSTRKFGDEQLFVVNTPEDEIVKGFPEVELKWMFGKKEVVVPKAISLHLYHGWKKWREEAKTNLKRKLLENVDFGRQYVAQRQVIFSFLMHIHGYIQERLHVNQLRC